MAQIKIQIEDTKLSELGIDQEVSYAVLRFKESALLGYWISKSIDKEHQPVIKVYLGGETFLCDYNEKNIEILENILAK